MSHPSTMHTNTSASSSSSSSSSSPRSYAQSLNPHVLELSIDYYYHLGLDSSMDVARMFGDTKFVLLCGSPVRALEIARRAMTALNITLPVGTCLSPIGKTERYSMYKIGCVLSVSHGMGKPSLSILLHELTKLMAAAKVADPLFIRIGTSGGLGVNPGTVIVSKATVNGALSTFFPVIILGKTVQRPTSLDVELARRISSFGGDDIPVTTGSTMATDDFYEGQGRIDGAICEHTLQDKLEFLQKAHEFGVRNIEMESDCLVAFCTKLNIRCAVVCCALLNRLLGDQVTSTPEQLSQYADNAIVVVLRFIQAELKLSDAQPIVPLNPHAVSSKARSAPTQLNAINAEKAAEKEMVSEEGTPIMQRRASRKRSADTEHENGAHEEAEYVVAKAHARLN